MSGAIVVRIHGLEELREKLQSNRADEPVSRFLNRGAIYIQGQGRRHAPVDTGRLQNSIGTESPNNRMRKIGPSAHYGEYVEKGTRPHYPPLTPLFGWAKRKGGLDPFAIQQSIGMWGTKAQPYMKPAADDATGYIPMLIPVLAAEIESAFQ